MVPYWSCRANAAKMGSSRDGDGDGVGGCCWVDMVVVVEQ